MLDKRVVSQTLLYGSIGGLVGLMVCAALIWAVNALWHPGQTVTADMVWGLKAQTVFIFYLPFGLLVGFAVTLIEPINDSSLGEAFSSQGVWLLLGALFGAAGMVIGGFLGEWIFASLSTVGATSADTMTILGRILGMLVMGVCVGSGLGLVDRFRTGSLDRFMAGLIGGGLGGVLAALVFQFLIIRPEAMPILPSILLAMFAAGAIGTVSFMRTDAVLIGMPGNKIFKYASERWRKQLLSDAPNFIGSGMPGRRSRQARFQIANDLDVVSEHAVIELDRSTHRWQLTRWSLDAVKLYVNNQALAGDTVALRDGDVVTFGGTKFRFLLTK